MAGNDFSIHEIHPTTSQHTGSVIFLHGACMYKNIEIGSILLAACEMLCAKSSCPSNFDI